jgi:ribosome maturation factor RimP
MDFASVTKRVGELATPILQSMGLTLVEATFRSEQGRMVLRVTVHRKGGSVALDELGLVNGDLSAILDVEDVVPGRYHLEVSSPGLTRQLREERDFDLFAGSYAQVTVREPDGGTRVLRGTLGGVEEGRAVVVTVAGREMVPLEDIARAKLDVEILQQRGKKQGRQSKEKRR